MREQDTTTDKGHGRIERRRLTRSDLLRDYLDWPGQQQVFMVEREILQLCTGEIEQETVYGLTSLGAGRAEAARLQKYLRRHWHIENRSHWVRDVTYDEDRSQVRVGSIPEVMAALRNTAIGLLRAAGFTNIAAATRRIAARPWEALALMMGCPTDF